MRRSIRLLVGSLLAALLLATSVSAIQGRRPATKQASDESSKSANAKTQKTAREQFYAMQASLFSALANARALEEITEGEGDPDFSLSRTLISTTGRSIQGTDTSSVALGQALHSVEKSDSMKTMRDELNAATKAADDAHTAADSHGAIGPHAKNMVAHLLKAMTALVELADEVGVKAMAAPGAEAIKNARREG